MTTKSSFLPRLSLRNGNDSGPVLPFYDTKRTTRRNPSEYTLSELSPRADDALLTPDFEQSYKDSPSSRPTTTRRSSSPSAGAAFAGGMSDRASTAGSASKSKSRVLFAGPPPPIAASRVLYRDEEESLDAQQRQSSTGGAAASSASRSPPERRISSGAGSFARSAIQSVLFDRSSPTRTRDQSQGYEPDTVWRNLQRRERALQKELQHLLDVQSSGLAGNLGQNDGGALQVPGSGGGSRSDLSDAGSNTPTGTFYTPGTSFSRHSSHSNMSASTLTTGNRPFSPHSPTTQANEVVPVRQPRQKPMSLRAARAALARNMALLADLKADEDTTLTGALGTRKKALAQLRRLSARRDGIAEELRVLEADGEDPLARELRELGEENEAVTAEIAELEERLVGLRNRRRWLVEKTEDVRNRREAGLSGYKGALKEVDVRVAGVLRKPPVKPLDVEAIAGSPGSGGDGDGGADEFESPGGVEFLRMRPERRTVDMAKQWWEREVDILERRKAEVDRERAALMEGAEVWKNAIKLVSDFETGLFNDLKGENDDADPAPGLKGKNLPPSPDEAMHAQLAKMRPVLDGLERHLRTAEDKGWNLLICAIGAELVAFQEGQTMLREALRTAGFDAYDEEEHEEEKSTTPPIMWSGITRASVFLSNGFKNDPLVDVHDDTTHERNDNEVPADLLATHDDEHDKHEDDHEPEPESGVQRSLQHRDEAHSTDHDDSENEVPPEFLAEHHDDED